MNELEWKCSWSIYEAKIYCEQEEAIKGSYELCAEGLSCAAQTWCVTSYCPLLPTEALPNFC